MARLAYQDFLNSPLVKASREQLAAESYEGLPQKPYLVQEKVHSDIRTMGEHLLSFVSEMTGSEMTLTNSAMWLTLVSPKGLPYILSQKWHRDPFPVGAVIAKLFWYLSDVDAGNGPFEYITGTARPKVKVESRAERYTRPDEQALYDGHPNRVVCTGPADTMILVNTGGLHKGGRCLTHERQMVAFEYMGRAS